MKHTELRRGMPRRLLAGIGVALMATAGTTGLAAGQGGGPTVQARGAAMATGARFVFSRPGSAPVEPPIDARFGAAGGSLDEVSDNAFGFASSFYPGDVPATPGSVIPLLGFPIGGQVFPTEHPIRKSYDSLPGLIPPWPMVTQGSYPGDPGKRVDLLQDVTGTIPAPLPTSFTGMTQETTVDQNLVVAETTIDKMTMTGLTGLNPEFAPLAQQLATLTKSYAGDQPGVGGDSVTVRGLNSTYKILSEGPRARSTSEIVVREVSLVGGLLQFFRVRSFALHEGTADGVKVLAYGTEVGLARVLGLQVTFDDKGAVLTDKRIPANQRDTVQQAINAVLKQTPFSVQATEAKVDGTRVTETAFTVVVEGQEPTLPGISPIGRHTKITLDFGSLDADLAVFAAPADVPDGLAGGLPGGSEGLPIAASDGLSAAPPTFSGAAPPVFDAGLPAAARADGSATGSGSGYRPYRPIVGAGPSGGPGETAAPPEGPQLAAPASVIGGGNVRGAPEVVRGAEGEQLVLLPGVVANAAEHREIAGEVQRSARLLVVLAGLGAVAALVMGRGRQAGLLR